MATKVKTGVIDSGAITSALITDASITADDLHTTLDLTGKTVTVATASASDNDTSVASTAYVTTAIANLADSAPSTLNTLNELAAALGDDANFSTTVTNSIATKAPLASPTLTGTVTVDTDTNSKFTIADGGADAITLYGGSGDELYIGANAAYKLRFKTDGNIVMDNGGNFGIGTDSPGDIRLKVHSNDSDDYIAIFKQTHASNLGTVQIDTPSDSNARPSRLDFARGGVNKWKTGMVYGDSSNGWGLSDATGSGTALQQTRFLVQPGGNVGIGTSSPDTMLHLSAGSTGVAGGGDAAITMTNKYDNPDNSWKIAPVRSGVSNTGLEIRDVTDSRTDMVFDGAGNVGIGTNNPGAKLHVQTSHTQTDVTGANSNSTLNVANSGAGNGVYNAIKFAANQQDMYIMSFNNNQQADRRLGFFLGSVAGDATTDERLSILGNGNVGIGTTTPQDFDSRANNLVVQDTGDGGITIVSGNSSDARIAFTNASDTGLNNGMIHYDNNDDSMHFATGGSDMVVLNNSASKGHLTIGYHGATANNSIAAFHGVGNDATIVVSNGSLTGNNSSYGWAGRGGRYLHSNGTGWVGDGSDPAIVIGSNNSGSNRSGIGIALHNESQNDDQFSPMIAFGNKSNSGSYNTVYATIVGEKKGSGVDANWSTGELHFDTAGVKHGGSDAYMKDEPAMSILTTGTVRKPWQPFIRARGNNASMVTNQGTNSNPFDPNWYTVTGRGITESGGVFTVPHTGTYIIVYNFYFWINNSGPAVTHSSMLYHNSTGVQEQTWESGSSSHSYYDNTKGTSFIMNMSTGDTFKFSVNADIYGGSTHTTVCAYMLG